MARTWTAASSSRITFGDPAAVRNLGQASLSVFAMVNRNSAAGNLMLVDKSSAITTRGWHFLLENTVNPGRPRLIVGGATYGDYYGPSAGIPAIGTDIFVGVAHTAGTTPEFFNTPIRTIPTASLATSTIQALVTPGTDAGDTLVVGNDGTNVAGFGGAIGWVAIYNTKVSLANANTIQVGMLVFRAGIIAGDTAMQTRGVNMMKSVAGFAMLHYIAGDGTLTEYSGNVITGAFAGTVTGADGAEQPLVLAPGYERFDRNLESGNQTLYPYLTAESQKSVTTDGATLDVISYRTLDITYDGNLTYGITPAYPTTVLTHTGLGWKSNTTGALGGGTKTVKVQTPNQSRPFGQPISESTFPVVFIGAAAATVLTDVAPVAGANRWVDYAESTGQGFNATPPQQNAPNQYIAQNLGGLVIDEVVSAGWGGGRVSQITSSTPVLDAWVTQMTQGNPRLITISLGANDKINNVYTTANFQAELQKIQNALMAKAGFTGAIGWLTPYIISAPNEASTGQMGTMDAVRAAILAVAATDTSGRTISANRKTWISLANMPDGVHYNNTGAAEAYAPLTTFLSTIPARVVGAISGGRARQRRVLAARRRAA